MEFGMHIAKCAGMNCELNEDFEKFGKMAFRKAADCTEVIKRFHALGLAARQHADFDLLKKVYEWVFVPMSVWPVDVRGLCLHLLDCVENGRPVDEGAKMLAEFLEDVPSEKVCGAMAEYEHAVKEGSYESLIQAQHKFDSMESELSENEEFKADWERLKRQFPVDEYRNARGVIRRRRVEERNFRASDWKFSWKTEAERFQVVFDAFCHRWNLYGVENEKPLLLKLSVNVTPFSTLIEVPRYWSFDPKRDLKWGAITKLHRMREVPRQGPKLDPGRAARRGEAARAKAFWQQATKLGMKGDRRSQWVMGKLGWDVRTDESRLRRMMKNTKNQN
jgi:hypothetical protein